MFTSSGVSQASKKTSSHSLSSASNITFMTLRDLLYGFEDNIDAAMHWWWGGTVSLHLLCHFLSSSFQGLWCSFYWYGNLPSVLCGWDYSTEVTWLVCRLLGQMLLLCISAQSYWKLQHCTWAVSVLWDCNYWIVVRSSESLWVFSYKYSRLKTD